MDMGVNMTVKLDANDIAKILGISKPQLQKMVKQNKFPPADEKNPGKPSYWYEQTLENHIDGTFQKIEQPEPEPPVSPLEELLDHIEQSHERAYNPYTGHTDYVAPTP